MASSAVHYTLAAQSEWMKAQKQATALAPSKAFQVIQSSGGYSTLFSLGEDGVLYAVEETQGSTTGWTLVDLTSSIAINAFDVEKAPVKLFRVSQNLLTTTFDLVIVITVYSTDYVFASLDNSASTKNWAQNINWTAYPFDGADRADLVRGRTIARVDLVTWPTPANQTQRRTCVVDIERKDTKPTKGSSKEESYKLMDRFYIDFTKKPFWNLSQIPVSLPEATIQSCIGWRESDATPGVYTLASQGSKAELVFSHVDHPSTKTGSSDEVTLRAPEGTTSIASAVNTAGQTLLFVSAKQGISLFSSEQQTPESNPDVIVHDSTTAATIQLVATSSVSLTALWGVNSQHELFFLSCPAGREKQASAWTHPVVIQDNLEAFAVCPKIENSSQLLFVQTAGQPVNQVFQDLTTNDWASKQVTLPSTNIDYIVETASYITQVTVVDQHQFPQPSVEVEIQATSTVPVLVNNGYQLLGPNSWFNVKTNATGAITITQEAETLAAVPYEIRLTATGQASKLYENPASKAVQTLSTTADLGKVTVTREDGSTASLVPSGAHSDDVKAATSLVRELGTIGMSLQSNSPQVSENQAKSTQVTKGRTSIAIDLSNNEGGRVLRILQDIDLFHGKDEKSKLDTIRVAAGDMVHLLGNHLKSDIFQISLQFADGLHTFITRVGNITYSTVVNTLSSAAKLARWVFDKLKVTADDLMSWVGYLFNWADIKNTQQLIYQLTYLFAKRVLSEIPTLEGKLKQKFSELETALKEKTDVKGANVTISSMVSDPKCVEKLHSIHSPQTSWSANHLVSGIGGAQMEPSSQTRANQSKYEHTLMSILDEFKGLVENELDIVKNAGEQIHEQVIDKIHTLSTKDMLTRVGGILGSGFIETAENVTMKLFDIVELVLELGLGALTMPIKIPILSHFYKKWVGEEPSLLGVISLVLAVPTTVICKAAFNIKPPEGEELAEIMKAENWAELVAVIWKPRATSSASNENNTHAAEAIPAHETMVREMVVMKGPSKEAAPRKAETASGNAAAPSSNGSSSPKAQTVFDNTAFIVVNTLGRLLAGFGQWVDMSILGGRYAAAGDVAYQEPVRAGIILNFIDLAVNGATFVPDILSAVPGVALVNPGAIIIEVSTLFAGFKWIADVVMNGIHLGILIKGGEAGKIIDAYETWVGPGADCLIHGVLVAGDIVQMATLHPEMSDWVIPAGDIPYHLAAIVQRLGYTMLKFKPTATEYAASLAADEETAGAATAALQEQWLEWWLKGLTGQVGSLALTWAGIGVTMWGLVEYDIGN